MAIQAADALDGIMSTIGKNGTVNFWPDLKVAEFSRGDEVYDTRSKFTRGVVLEHVPCTTSRSNYLKISWIGIGVQEYDSTEIDYLVKVKRRRP